MIEAIIAINADNEAALLKALDRAKEEIKELRIMDAYASVDVLSYARGESDSSLTIDLQERAKPNVHTIGSCNSGKG